MNFSTNDTLYFSSVKVIRSQFSASVAWAVMAAMGVMNSGILLLLVFTRKQLRNSRQIGVVALALSDSLESLGLGMMACKRLYLGLRDEPELTSQQRCMEWLFFMNTTLALSCLVLLCLSVERLLAVALPIWYRERQKKLITAMLVIAAVAALVIAAIGVLDASPDVPNVACTAGSSYPHNFSDMLAAVQNGGTGVVVLVNVVTMLLLLLRYRRARKSRAVESFKRDMELSAVKILLALLVLFCISMGLGNLFNTVLLRLQLSDQEKAVVTPFSGCSFLLHGVCNCWIYVYFGSEYRASARHLLGRCFPCLRPLHVQAYSNRPSNQNTANQPSLPTNLVQQSTHQ